MFNKKKANLVLGALNLLVAGSPILAHASEPGPTEKKQEQLNAASFKSIEGTWLQVPTICKAKNFNASPNSGAVHDLSSVAKSVYSSYAV